ncbi:MAG: hypothetical protein RMM98_15310 [Acidobacteriota bacterium]|nr:hypothetical protein [Blastocatellia bacterium]MDW8240971.1 hypothetical protein [Acidobacteriota bacterium]
MTQKNLRTSVIVALSLILTPPEFGAQQDWYQWKTNRVGLYLCNTMPVIIIGQAVDFCAAQWVQIYSQNTSRVSGIRFLRIRVEETLKGTSWVPPGTELEAIVIPSIIDYGNLPPGVTNRQLFEKYRETGELPRFPFERKERYPEVPLNRATIFFLFSINYDDTWVEWAGLKEHYGERSLWGYAASLPINADGSEIRAVKRCIEISHIRDPYRRDQEHLSLALE